MVQDITKSMLKSKYDNLNEFAIEHQKLIDDIVNKFTPEMIVLCEIPPILNNEEAYSKLEITKNYLNDTYSSKPGFLKLKFIAMIRNINKRSFEIGITFMLMSIMVYPFCAISFVQYYANNQTM